MMRKMAIVALKWMALLLIAIFILLIAGIWREQSQPVSLPLPDGPYAIGRINPVWQRDAASTGLSGNSAQRSLLGWIWYPANKQVNEAATQSAAANYLPPSWQAIANSLQGAWWLVRLLNKNPALIQAHSVQDARPADGKFPVILLRPGLSAMTVKFSALAENLASHGYIVVGFDVPYRTGTVALPDNRP
jgi:hypothetical protein